MGTTEKWKHVIFVCDMFEDRIGFKQALEYDCVMKKSPTMKYCLSIMCISILFDNWREFVRSYQLLHFEFIVFTR